ncbi:MAG: adenine-specific methyltransferase EcoRI family protein [bacterium]|nr:adenine-specific methyltransferase EcoRI family protein [bacterium]
MNTKSSNTGLHKAAKAKNDEFYTQLSDIEKELKHYKDQFRGKRVYCNCDDPFESNFFKYFAANFNALGLKTLVTTSYVQSPIVGGQLPLFEVKGLKPDGKEPFKIEINEVKDLDSDGAVGLPDVEWLLRHDANVATPLKSDGDFRSKECIELLKKADIVVTNPPFSLFREYVAQLVLYDKKFLIIGNTNAVKYNDIFKLIKNDKFRTGYTNFNVGMFFVVPDHWEKFHHIDENGKKIARVSTACWFTNLDVSRHHELLTLYKKYTPDEYPKYDNYDAINVDKYPDIPTDYDGNMGVPITFLDKYNPNQFEILGIFDDKREKSDAFIQGIPTYVDEQHKNYVGPVINGKALYTRVLIKNKKLPHNTL